MARSALKTKKKKKTTLKDKGNMEEGIFHGVVRNVL